MIKLLLLLVSVVALALFLYFQFSARAQPKVGEPAPPFSLPDQHDQRQRLSDFKGHWLVLYFYPKDDTPGCTKEACHFRDDHTALQQYGAKVVGISVDSSAAHAQFANKYRLPFPLLADTSGQVAQSYGALMHLGWLKLAKRHTFLIDPEGRVAKVYVNVDPNTHSQTLLKDIQALQE